KPKFSPFVSSPPFLASIGIGTSLT
ncbi:hypothetical protein CCACVL1_00782, partial [Corchorus capsularis]